MIIMLSPMTLQITKFVCVEQSHIIKHGLKKTFDDQGIKLPFCTTLIKYLRNIVNH